MAFYTDGHADISVRPTGTVVVSRWKVMIGENAMWSGRGWNGLIDDVRIYSYALTEEEVKELYESTRRNGQESEAPGEE